MSKRARPAKQRGVVLIMLSIILIVAIPLAGLAFDVGLLYLIRTKLSAAVDAAVMAGARSLSRGLDLASQVQNAQSTALQYFNANFPEGLYNTTNRSFTSSVTESDYRTRTVSAVGTVTAPLYFLRLLGQSTTVLAARATASRRDVNLILVLDRSGSIAQAGATAAVKNSSIAFVEKFAEGRDRIGLISFSGYWRLDFAPSTSFKSASPSIVDRINALVMDGNTGYAEALWQAYEQLRIINEPGALNVIVFFTDGRPTALTASFPVKTVSDRRYGDGSYPYSSTSSLYTMPASSCKSSAAKLGFFSAQGPNYGYTLETQIQGVTWGVMDPDATTSQDEWTLAADSSGCAYAAGSGSSYRRRARRDIAYIPDSDTHGNSTWGYKSFTANQDLFPNGHPYAGKIRPDSVRAVRYAAYNLADNIAQRVRNDASLVPIIFCIGLGGTSNEPIDHELLRRVANDRESPIFDSSKPAGLYVYAPSAAQLDQAFLRVASEILRMAE